MKFGFTRAVLLTVVAALVTTTASAQDLGPHFKNSRKASLSIRKSRQTLTRRSF